ncbi:hypothetical protein Poly30_53590 [Planctomycetes bacterium Poly30]|uniref:Beta-lactamase class A catalytic domain-containing protein n=2 Tax=Saltatorellus ferox TaxID=2528018 RepID=A0A518F0F3_9BACT|nr:hypothetical protein Poly30_53590 [Planctomycetes bacterium Poly30]
MGCQGAPSLEAQRHEPDLLTELMAADPGRFSSLLATADDQRLKIELAIVVEGEDGSPTLERHSFDAGPEYFYPASSVKTCAAIAAALQLRDLGARSGLEGEVSLDTPLRFQPLFEGEVVEEQDASHRDGGTITLAHEMRKVFLVSDNGAYNRLYEFAGNAYLNERMRAAGLESTRILHRLSEFHAPEDQLKTPRVELLRDGQPIAAVPERVRGLDESNAALSGTSIGRGYMRGGELVEEPMSFVQKNYIQLRDLQDMQIMLLRPDVRIPGRPASAGFALEPDDRELMRAAMAATPGGSTDPVYDSEAYPDSYSKFLGPGVWRVLPKDEVTIRDKVGRAYGFSITNSEVTEKSTGRAFFLAATLYHNPNGILNDNLYDYPVADRFLEDLGEVVARHVFGD